ncbi:MAG TPA: pyridoxamine 5'-phosphate oxidase family protein [Tepidiformaceae bacterium]|nr:pyridoxamine 5'-phosphate oxidase family protein [Tepidiformaceae bacterium]
MGFTDLDGPAIESILQSQRVIRVAFDDGHERYLIPLFFAWHDGALCGLTTPGRKTRMAEASPTVAFQIDTSAETGPYEWQSVSGEGRWETVTGERDMAFIPALQAKLADSPSWARELLMRRFETLGRVAWRIRPTTIGGRAHSPG